jgi:hypothetical protein
MHVYIHIQYLSIISFMPIAYMHTRTITYIHTTYRYIHISIHVYISRDADTLSCTHIQK